MEPNNQGDAADLEAHLDAIAERVGDPSSTPLLYPQQELAAPVERPPPRMPQSPPTATPDMLQPQPEARSDGGVELSPGDRIRKITHDWLRGVDKPGFNAAPDAPNPSAAPNQSELNVNAEEYRASASHSVGQSSSTPGFSASQGQTSAGGPGPGSSKLEEDKARLLQFLKDRKVVPKGVFNFVRAQDALHFVMRSRDWGVVFDLLLTKESLDVIVHVACESGGGASLMSVTDTERGVKSLNEFFKAVEKAPQLRQLLVSCLLNEGRLFHHRGGPDLLRSIFSTFHDEDSSAVIRHALGTFTDVLSSKIGSECMVECLALAKTTDLQDFEEFILNNTVEFAKGTFRFSLAPACRSNHFLQRVLERGSDQLKMNITQSVVENLVSLSMHRTGTFVVQACFVRTGSVHLQLLERVLEGLQGLPLEELDRLVQDSFAANHVVSKLLLEGKAHFLARTTALAQTIEKLPAAGLDGTTDPLSAIVGKVMQAVREVLSC
ncbi:unnamed protein product [Urochloa decumbens]|uniref:Uncharacterized protein n=1 Tax=Urochloa decumbens TaxID=240449 RepID=A0ABC8XQT2_9POAL